MAKVDIDEWMDRDLTAEVRAGTLPPAFEVEELLSQAEDVLQAQGRRSVVFVGPPGIGKTAMVQELVRRAHAGTGVELLATCRVVQFSLRAIATRFKERSDATNFFGDLCTAIQQATDPPVLPYFRDVHLAYHLDWEPMLHRFLIQLPRPILAEALPREFEQLTEYWSDLSEHLLPIPVEEPELERVQSIVRGWCAWHAEQRGRVIREDAQRIAIELTARFMGDKPYPRKVLDLLRQTVDFHKEDGTEAPPVGVRDVVHRFSQMTRVPARLVDPDQPLDLVEVREFVTQRLLGQEEAVDAVVRMIALIKAGLADLRRPFGAFLFVGPTGVGKTHTAQLLAEYLFGDRNRVIRINMADYGHEGQAQLLFGNPYATQLKDQRGLITTRLQGHPFGVLLLDEFEKAHEKIHDAFLQLVDEGRFINGRSETVSVTSLIVIATSNAGSEVYRQQGLGFDLGRDLRELDRELDRRLHRVFRFEFLNRFDRIVHFHPLSRAHIRDIARRELTELARRDGIVSRNLDVQVDAEVLDWLVAHGYHPHYGARFLRREIERHVAATLAEFIVRELPPRGSQIALGVRHDRIEARLVSAPDLSVQVRVPQGDQDRPLQLDRDELLAEARAWLQRWEALEAESEERREQASQLIDASTERGFWDDTEQAQEVLRRYKSLDARLQTDRRLVKPVQRLRRLMERPDDVANEELAELVEQAALNYRRWIDIGSADQPDAAWLIIAAADGIDGCSDWLVDLVALYRGWLRRKGYSYEVVAEEVVGGEVARVVLDVEGPGVLSVLEMEEGEHRRRGPQGKIERAVIEVVPHRAGPSDETYPHVRISDAKRNRGLVVPRRSARLELDLPARGLHIVLQGTHREALQALGRDLSAAMATPGSSPKLARTYGLVGGTVRDPRTGASSAGIKDIMRGNLEVFLRAWDAR